MTKENTLLLLLALERFLDGSDHATQSTEQWSEAEAPALNAHRVDEEVHQGPIRHDKDAEDTEISPCLASLDVKRCKVAVGVFVRTVLAISSGVRIKKVSAC